MTARAWPLGDALQQQRIHRGMSKREAARAAGLSDTAWRTLERGYEVKGGHQIPASPRAETVTKAARAVGLSVDDALRVAGFSPDDDEGLTYVDLSWVSDADLLAEVIRRMR